MLILKNVWTLRLGGLKKAFSSKWGRVLSNLALVLISFYQLLLSPFFGGYCRFEPSCSCYAKEAFRNHSFQFALRIVVKRLLRCHPWGGYGIDLVPTRVSPREGQS